MKNSGYLTSLKQSIKELRQSSDPKTAAAASEFSAFFKKVAGSMRHTIIY